MTRATPILLLVAAALLPLTPGEASAQVAVRGKTVHPVSGPPIENGVVVVQEGKITRIGPASRVSIPAGLRILEAEVVTPGLVDAHTVVGLSGALNQKHDQDQLERSAAIQPELRAVDAYNARELLVDWVRSFGVTTIHTGHGPGSVVSGQTLIAKTRGRGVEADVIRPVAMIAATIGNQARKDKGSPGTRSKIIAMLRAELIKAQAYVEKHESRDLRLEALGRVIEKEIPLLVTVHRAQDITTALRVASEFDIRLVLDGVAESHLVLDEIRESGFPVLLHPTMARARGDLESLSMETAAKLDEAGIPFALQSGFEGYVPKTRVVLFEAAVAAAHGLPFDRALASITLDAARILGIEDRVGSLEVGKDGDLALYDGDPFEYASHCVGVVIEGEVVSEVRR